MDSPENIKTLTSQLENGDATGLSKHFQGKFEEERIETLNLIAKQNQSNRSEHPEIPKLEIDISSYPGTNHENVRLDRGTWQESFFGAKQIFASSLHLRDLKRMDDEAPVPPNRKDLRVDVEALTTRLERGEGVGTKEILAPLFEEERIRVLQEVQKINEQHLAQNKTNAHLYVEINSSKTGSDYLSVERRLPGGHDDFFGGPRLYRETLNLRSLKREIAETQDERK